MPINIVVPELSESVVEATVAEWLVNEGDEVTAWTMRTIESGRVYPVACSSFFYPSGACCFL